jgi:hypothetical protein
VPSSHSAEHEPEQAKEKEDEQNGSAEAEEGWKTEPMGKPVTGMNDDLFTLAGISQNRCLRESFGKPRLKNKKAAHGYQPD